MVKFISEETKLDFNDVLLVPRLGGPSSRSSVVLEKESHCAHSYEILSGIGIIAANMDSVGTIPVAEALAKRKIYTALTKKIESDTLQEFFRLGWETDDQHASDYSFYSMGISTDDYTKFDSISKQVKIPRVCIDVANGYMGDFTDYISRIRDEYPDITILAGNVVTPEAVEALYYAGADIIKMGIGSGAVCTTRLVAGTGYPQLSTILDSVDVADSIGALICSDGGCVYPGDVAKAFAAGSDFVMLGTMLAGSFEGGARENEDNTFYGMSSKTANDKHFGGLKNYRSSEGRTIKVPYKGHIDDIIQHILGGVTSACTYAACTNIAQLSLNAQFIKVNNTHNRSVEQFTIGY